MSWLGVRVNLDKVESAISSLRNHYLLRSILEGTQSLLSDGVTKVSLLILLTLVLAAIFGPMVTPYSFDERVTTESGELLRLEPPSVAHPLGTTEGGYDVLSRILYGARPTLITGFASGLLIVGFGLAIGVTAGYFGGPIESSLMRFTDFAYGVPLIPFAIVLVAYFGTGFWATILIIGLILWRGNARVFRSQVLQIKERPYIRSARALGASHRYIVFRLILPNMGGMIVLFFALGVGIAIVISASLAFLGATSPFVPSWGVMLRNAYNSGFITDGWWWTLPPGFLISLTVLSTFLIGRGYEKSQNVRVGES